MLQHMKIHHYTQNRKHLYTALLIATISSPLAVTAGVYKWTDENGNVHYGSQRPTEAPSEKLKIQGDTTPYADDDAIRAETEETKKSDKEGEGEKKPEAAAPKAAEQPKLSKKEKKGLCQQARKNVQTIESRGRVRVKQEDGSSRHLTDPERTKELAAARKNVSKYCK